MALDINPSSITKESVHDFLSEIDTDVLMNSIDDMLDSFGDSERKRAQRVIDESNKEHEKQIKKEKDKYQCEVDKIYKELIENTLDDINEELVDELNRSIRDTLAKLVSHDSACFTGLISDFNINNDGGFSTKIYPRFSKDAGQNLRKIFSDKYLNKTVVLKSDLGDFEGKIISDDTSFAQDTVALIVKGSVCDILMQGFKDAGYHVELVTDKDNKKGIYVSL